MSKTFEEQFMDLQSGMISLCLEAVGKPVDKVFAYASIEKNMKSFNVFFESSGKIVTLRQIGANPSFIRNFLMEGVKDLGKVEALCQVSGRPCPFEMKMIYDLNTGSFDADYQYESVCGADKKITSAEVFIEWMNSVK